MTDLALLLAGPRFCPWCRLQRCDSFADRITDRLPHAVIGLLLHYDAAIGRIAIPLHQRLHGAAG